MFKAMPLVPRDTTLFKNLDLLADATNFILVCWLLIVLIAGTKRQVLSGKDWLAVALAIASVYIVKILDSKLHVWDRLNLNYSTHSALAMAVVTSLFFLAPPHRMVAIAVFVAYEGLVFLLGFHSLLDILTTLIVAAPLVLLCLRIRTPKQPEIEPS